jgi:hypothetical protein
MRVVISFARSTFYSQHRFSEIALQPTQWTSIRRDIWFTRVLDSALKRAFKERKVLMKKLFISLLLAIVFCGGLIMEATAQSNVTSQPSTGFIGWDTSKPKSSDVALTSIIQEVVPNQASGIPAGLHIMLGTPQGVLDANVGPYLPPDVQQALVAGKQVQVFGQVKTIHDQKYLLVRQLVLDGKPIIVRNDHGSLIRTRSQERTHTQSSSNSQNGGIQ